MSSKKGQSAAVELKIEISPREVAVLFSTIFLGSLGILGIVRLLNILDSRGLSFIADLVHLFGVVKLGFNLGEEKTRAAFILVSSIVVNYLCAGLSLKSLQLTELCLTVKLCYGFLVQSDVRVFDMYSFFVTLWAIYMVGSKYKSSYHVDSRDNFNMLYLVIACALLSLVIHPMTPDNILSGVTMAFYCYLHFISMLPQLQAVQRREIVDPITANCIFMLGCARLLYVENWVIEILLTQGQSATFLGYTSLDYNNIWWPFIAVLLEIVNGFFLADFCYYYFTLKHIVNVSPLNAAILLKNRTCISHQIWLKERSSDSRFFNFPKDDGIWLVKALCDKLR
ncbi:hypothetical protein FH972_011578 [Carpinus fangiana]|uniref:ER lumen protein-retaining receptor n=1 Tax=Carpinus fangiana TaxID=176857 RepID=A0A660KYQ7_9ROSI|nr:hypothetical protein FH972_011578 [Carpinus fangiana]